MVQSWINYVPCLKDFLFKTPNSIIRQLKAKKVLKNKKKRNKKKIHHFLLFTFQGLHFI